MSFRIAAIKVLDGCKPYVRKKLKEGNVYLFSSRYIEDKYNALTLEFNREVTGNFFAESMYNINRSAGVLEVSINAIVGKNGDGKSSLLEIMLRILNNFAYTRGFLEDQPTLKFVDGVNAILYYEIDSTIYSIKCEGKTVSWYKNGEEILMHEGNDKQKKRFLQENFVPIMFYTMVINYSLYAYTATSLGGGNSDDGYWIDGLFHKNDSYQTPVVLNPMRTKGVIDINKEEYLSKQRLMSIFVSSDGQDEVRMVSSNEKAVGYAFSLEKESKFLKNTISKYFNDSFQD
jgi:energy-coupling factor transporter ATP-binding protein EcfA2